MTDKTNELKDAVEAWRQKHEAGDFRIHSGAVMCFEEGFQAGYDHAAAESVLECVVCGERSFVISPINDSDGFCFAEQKIYSITWPTLADPDGNIDEVETKAFKEWMNTHEFQPGDPEQGWENQCSVIAPDGLRHCGGYRKDHSMNDHAAAELREQLNCANSLITLVGKYYPLAEDAITFEVMEYVRKYPADFTEPADNIAEVGEREGV